MTADTVGGVWTYALELTRALAEQDVQVVLATMGNPLSREQRREVKHLTNVELHESTFKLEWMENPWPDVARAGQWLLEIEQRTQPDVIHLNGYAHGALPFQAPKVVVGHSCVPSWWRAVKGSDAPATWSQYREVVQAGLQAAHLVITPSKAMLDQLHFFYGNVPGRVIYNGRDPALFCHARKEEIILSAGRLWDEAKNIRALENVSSEIPWPIYVAGEAKPPGGSIARRTSLCTLGKLPTDLLARWYGKASIYALPARYEPFGLSVLEAGLAGCALVLGNIPSLRELWNGAALFVRPDDMDELRFTLQRIIESPFRRKELAAYAQCRAIQFTPKRMASEYLAAYAEVMAAVSVAS
jgi:glycogen synthase